MLLLVPPGAAWLEHDDISREFAWDVIEALRQCGISQLAASQYMWGDDKHESELSRQLAGVKPLNIYRLLRLPLEFQAALLRLRAKRIGIAVVEDTVMAELVNQVHSLVQSMKGQKVA